MFGRQRSEDADDVDAQTTCKKCGKKVFVSDLKINPETKTVMCSNCVKGGVPTSSKPMTLGAKPVNSAAASALGQMAGAAGITSNQSTQNATPRNATEAALRPTGNPRPMPTSSFGRSPTSAGTGNMSDSKIKKKCGKCNFVFTFDTATQNPKFCPYCREKIV